MIANVHQYWVYMMSNKTRSVLYIGITNDLYRRYNEHKAGTIKGFTQNYKCHYLVYFEEYQNVNEAIAREKQLKGWIRARKNALIATVNPENRDLAEDLGWIVEQRYFTPFSMTTAKRNSFKRLKTKWITTKQFKI